MIDPEYITAAGVVLVIAEFAGVLLAFDVVMRPRSSQGTIAWFIALISIPLITIPLYLLFGRTRFHGYAEAIRGKESRIGEQWVDWYTDIVAMAAPPVKNMVSIEAVVRRLTRIPFTRGNEVELLIDGEATYNSMLEAIAKADTYIFVQFYIVRDDGIGRRLRDALIEKARAGVRVCFLYDEIGCLKLPGAYLDAMRNESIKVSGFKTTQGRNNRFQINFRNHRKLIIVDGLVSFIGGLNLGDEYLTFRDTHMKIEGPASQAIQLSFIKDWYWATGLIPENSKTVKPSAKGKQAAAIVNTGPADNTTSCSILFTTLINMAQHRLWITSPYFVPDDVMVRAFQAAAIRGVDVRIILPGKVDKKLVQFASFTYYESMVNCGVRLFRYRERFMHQKVILVDNELAGIGTVNLDNRAVYLNFEATGLIADKGFAKDVEAMLIADLACSEEVRTVHFDEKPLWFRIFARVSRLASPLL